MKPNAALKNRIRENKDDQSERINKALQKDIDIYCTFKPEINASSREMLKNNKETKVTDKVMDKDYDFIKEFIEQNRSLLKSYKDYMGSSHQNNHNQTNYTNNILSNQEITKNNNKKKTSKSKDRESSSIINNNYLNEIQTFGFGDNEKHQVSDMDLFDDDNI